MGVLRDTVWVITSRWNRWRGSLCSTHAWDTYIYTVLCGKPEGKKRFGSTTCKCENNIKIEHHIWREGVNSIHGSGHGQVTGCCEHGNETLGSVRLR